MSNQKDDLDSPLSEAKKNAQDLLRKRQLKKEKSSAVEIAKTRSPKDVALWVIALTALTAATFVGTKLPGIWQPANDIWVRAGIIIALVVLALVCFALTHQGYSFKVLLKDAGIELRRVTWPSRSETVQYTWQSIVVIGIVAFIVWLLDTIFTRLVGMFIG